MNTLDILFYGNKEVGTVLQDIPKEKMNISGVCGEWSVKDILGHVTAFEHLLEEVLNNTFGDPSIPKPYMDEMAKGNALFNQYGYTLYTKKNFEDIHMEYTKTYERVMELARKIPAEKFGQVGVIPWYGNHYCVDDFIVYASYGHKREHCAQIAVFKDTIKNENQ